MLLNLDSIPSYYKNYVKLVDTSDLFMALRKSGYRMAELVHAIPEDLENHRYAPEKWTVKEVLCHVLDTERIMCYRALRFARNDRTPLAGFDEGNYGSEANAANRSLSQIANDMSHLRTSTLDLFQSFSTDMLTRTGKANNLEMSVMAIGFIIAGHETHHGDIIKNRYLKK